MELIKLTSQKSIEKIIAMVYRLIDNNRVLCDYGEFSGDNEIILEADIGEITRTSNSGKRYRSTIYTVSVTAYLDEPQVKHIQVGTDKTLYDIFVPNEDSRLIKLLETIREKYSR